MFHGGGEGCISPSARNNRNQIQGGAAHLILTIDENMVDNLEVHSPLGNSDHGCLKFHLVCCRERKVPPRKMYLYDEGNYSSMKKELAGVAWNTLLTEAEGDPGAIKKKHRNWQRYMETKDKNKYAKFARARNKVKAISKGAQKELERNICGNLKDNLKRFWGYLKSRTRVKEMILDLERLDGNGVASTDNEKADGLSKYFKSVYIYKPTGTLPMVLHPKVRGINK